MKLPVILHIPHSSLNIPAPYLDKYLVTASELQQEQIRLTDMYTDELYHLPQAERAVFPVSRFLVDAERFADDSQELMAARGMGAIYTVTTQLTPLRQPPSPEERAELMAAYYYPHHERLNEWADKALATAGHGLLVDCHSYPSRVLPYELETEPRSRPQIGIGTDSFHTPTALADAVVRAFTCKGYEVGHNSPFAGALVPGRHYGRSADIHAFMIEVRKDLYMNELTGEKLPSFGKVRADITEILESVIDAVF